MREPTVDVFLKDIAEHNMTVLLDSGIHRHIRFRRPGDSNHWFEIVTWPYHLTLAGDMGTWTFSRLEDMLTFFRSSREIYINASYWAEKLQNGVHGGSDQSKVFCAEKFGERLLGRVEGDGLEGTAADTVRQAIKDDILCYDTEWEMMEAARDFECNYEEEGSYENVTHDRTFQFESCELPDAKVYCYHFIWCLYAIVWGIQQYDSAAARESAA